MSIIFNGIKGYGNLDYVACWYKKAANFIKGKKIKCAFVSTNSITQGEQVAILFSNLNIHINFAYRSFTWISESSDVAQVHCVIIGFSNFDEEEKFIYQDNNRIKVNNINGYLIDADDIYVESCRNPICDVPRMIYGSFALDNGNYTFDEDIYHKIINKEPNIKKYIKLFLGADEFINKINRYCIWLKDADISEVRRSNILYERVKSVQEWRRKSDRLQTRKAAETPMLFAEIRQPNTDYLAIPITSSQNRQYIPMGYISKDIIASNHLFILPNASLYHFGVLTSNIHMAWVRFNAGRRKSDYNYSANIVYNNFVWCNPTEKQRQEIDQTAQKILDARKLYPESSLADLYNDILMPPELRKAHQANDRAVMKAYGFDFKLTEAEIVAELMKMYQKLTS